MSKEVRIKELFECRTEYLNRFFDNFEFPWELLPKINDFINEIISDGNFPFKEISDGVFVGDGVKIAPTATIEGPAIFGSGTEIRPNAYIRGRVITGKNCVIGNASELKNCILLEKVQVPHYNYVGDSVLGNSSHLGAGAICSNLKSDKKDVVVHGDIEYKTGLKKLGAILGDGADVGCGCVLNPGTVIGKDTSVYPLNSVRGVVPSGCIYKNSKDIIERI